MTIQHTKIIIGPPGTGKTTRLLDITEEELKQVAPNRIAFVSFTKKAVDEAIDRATSRFGFSRTDMVYFRTIHSMAFMSAGLRRDNVMQPKDYKKIGDHLGITFSGRDIADGPGQNVKHKGDYYTFIDSFSKARHMTPRDVWDMMNHSELNWYEFLRYQDTVIEYKKKNNMIDFTDMLMFEPNPLDVDVAVIDEAQDLSTAQWRFVLHVFSRAKRIYIGGDDDQAIFEWSGADVNHFIGLTGDRIVLSQSYRIPDAVHRLACDITGKIKYRTGKQYHSRKERGEVDYWMSVDDIDMSSGTWLLLARNSYLLGELGQTVRRAGHPYMLRGKSSILATDIRAIKLWERYRKGESLEIADIEFLGSYTSDLKKNTIWHEAFDKMEAENREYYVSLLRRGESLTKVPRISIGTIHSSKGGEADHVALLTDMSYNTWDSTHLNMDSEHRVWYVGATRCRETLHVVQPRGRYFYTI